MQVGRWENGLVLPLPDALVERLGLAEGDEFDSAKIEAALTASHDEERQRRRDKALEEIRQRRWTLPDDWKFDREEANWRPAMDRW